MLQEGEISYSVGQICVENSDQNTSKLKYFSANLWFRWEFYKDYVYQLKYMRHVIRITEGHPYPAVFCRYI
jgi:hypothetical protein